MPRLLAHEDCDPVCTVQSWHLRKLGAFAFYYTTSCVSSLLSKSRLTRSLPPFSSMAKENHPPRPITNVELPPAKTARELNR